MITFNNEDTTFKLKNKTLLKQWITLTIQKKKRKAGEINFIFCSDDYLLNINKQYLNHDTYTDIITFDYSKEKLNKKSPLPPLQKGNISGDIYISVDRIKENAIKFSKTFENELHRVLIHGVLHLLGYKDKTKIAKAEMTQQEDLCLKNFQKIK